MLMNECIQVCDLMWGIDFIKVVYVNFGKGVMVICFVFGDGEKDLMEFEIVVIKIGGNCVLCMMFVLVGK